MAKDFKAGQVKTSKIIGKDGLTMDDKKIVFYTHDAAGGSDEGVHGVPLGNDDVSFVFAGTPGAHDVSTVGGVALFNGDVVISGTLYAENQVIQLDSDAPGGLKISGAVNSSPVGGTAIHIEDSGTLGTHNGWIVWDTGEAKIGEGENKLVLTGDDGIHEDSKILRNNTVAVSGSGPESWSSPYHIATCEDIEAHVSDEVAVVATAVAAEETRALAAEGSLQVRLATEEAALAAEIAATNADVGSIDTRVAADEAALAAEIAATNADVGSVDTRVAAEEGARAAADGSLQTRLAAEEAARAAADGSLQTRLAADEAALAAEIVATNADVGSIDTRIAGLGAGGGGNLTTAGDLEVYDGVQTRLPVGTDGYVLTADSTVGPGLKWAAASGGGSMSSFTIDDGTVTATITDGNTLDVIGGPGLKTDISASGGAKQIDINHEIGSLTTKTTPAAGDFLIIEDNSGLPTIKKVDWNSLPSAAGGMTNFTIQDNEASPGTQTIEDGNTLIVAGGAGLKSTVSATDTLTIDLDIAGLTTLSPSTAAATDLLIVQDISTGNTRKVTVGNLPSTGGSSSAGTPGEIQVSDGSGGFDAASIFKYHPAALSADSRVSLSTGGTVTSPDARLEIVNAQADSFHCLRLEQLINTVTPSTRSNMMPFLIESNTDNSTPDVGIANKGTIGQIILANNFVSGAPPTYKSSTISLDDDDFKIINNQNDGIVQIIGSADPTATTPPAQYDVIRGEGNTVHKPCVTILTDPTSPAAAIASTDINFYVEGMPGSLGSAVNKKSAQFGGDLSVNGFVSRGGLIQLTKDTPQRIGSPAWNGLTTWDLTNVPRGVITFDNALFNDPLNTFYSFTPGNDHLTVERTGVYRISYGAWTWQAVNTDLSVNDGSPGAPPSGQTATLGQRSNVAGRLVKDTGSGFSIVDNSYSSCYLRFTYITKHLFTATTFVSANAGDKIGVEIAWIGGDNPGGAEFSVKDGQTWLTVEKIQ